MILNANTDTITKKEYMGRVDLVKVHVPSHVTTIENWAFAQCTNLRTVAMPSTLKHLGKDVFLDCAKLDKIVIYKGDCQNDFSDEEDAMAELVAIALLKFDDVSLKIFSDIGSASWIEKWDESCMKHILLEDSINFSPFLAGGEEDYEDKDNNLEYYCSKIRKSKINMVVRRLCFEKYFSIKNGARADYIAYLRKYLVKTDGVGIGETMEVLFDDIDNISAVFDIYDKEKFFEEVNIDELIAMTSASAVELTALLIKKKSSFVNSQLTWDEYEL